MSDTQTPETDLYRRLVSGPVEQFLTTPADATDRLDLATRVDRVEETLRHWMAHAVPYAAMVDASYDLVVEQSKMIAALEDEVRACHREALEVVAVLADRIEDFERWTAARSSRSDEVQALLIKSDRWCDYAQRFIADRS